jgi:Domain of unknown function (DUF4091)
MAQIRQAALVGLLAGLCAHNCRAGVRAIWSVNDSEKVDRDDLNHPSKSSNSTWDGKKVRLFGARNEIVAFQVIIEADSQGIASLSARLPELSQRGGVARIVYIAPELDPSRYVDRPIQVFSVNYMEVVKPTAASWIYRLGSPSAPRNPTGWKPVQLVPENARKGKGGFPLTVAPSRNQALWFEIYLRRDLPAGVFQGNVELSIDGKKIALPVELELLDFALPDKNSMHAMVYHEAEQPILYQGRELDAVYHRFAHRQRIELVHAYDEGMVNRSIGRFRGGDFTPANGYEGPGEGVGNRIVPLTFYGPGKAFDERSSAWKRSDDWMTFVARTLPAAITFLYMPDEPSPKQFPYIRKLADNIHSNPGPGGKLPVFVTHGYTKELEGAIDIWDSGPHEYAIGTAERERAKGRDYWFYNGGRPWGGAIVIDAPAADSRATIWGCFKHGIRVYFYWHGDHWRHNTQKPGNRIQNVWANPVTFDNRGQPNKPVEDRNYANGDGVLFYPGEEKLHPEEDRGIAGPCSTIQLANFRRGLQDHLYLTLARQQGLETLVQESLRKLVPAMFSEAGETIGFSEKGDDYEQARYRLGKALAAHGK